MSDNRYTGDVAVKLGDTDYTMNADWDAIATAQETFDDVDVLKSPGRLNARQLATLIAILLKKHHPDVTAELIMKLSPPLNFIMPYIHKTLLYAYRGADEVEEIERALEEAAKQADKKPAKKK